MKQLEFFDIPSPCIGVCEAGPRGYCLGCFRSREERLHWLNLDDSTKRHIVKACARRKLRAAQQQAGKHKTNTAPTQPQLWSEDDVSVAPDSTDEK